MTGRGVPFSPASSPSQALALLACLGAGYQRAIREAAAEWIVTLWPLFLMDDFSTERTKSGERPEGNGSEDGSNWYAYCNNDPINYTDPLGLCAEEGQNIPAVVPLPDNLPDNFPIWPVQGGGVKTSPYGPRINPVTGRPSEHKGIDIAAPQGTNVLAVLNGTVSETGSNDPIYGNYIEIDHGEGAKTLYVHMEKAPGFSPGDNVEKGTVLGGVGSTGQSTGPHLHFQQTQNGESKDPFDSLYAEGQMIIN